MDRFDASESTFGAPIPSFDKEEMPKSSATAAPVLASLSNVQARIRGQGEDCVASALTMKKKKKRPGGLSLPGTVGALSLSTQAVVEHHVLGCKHNPIPKTEATSSPSRMKGKTAAVAKKLLSPDIFTTLLALEEALSTLIEMGTQHKEYPALFTFVAGVLDKMEGADILFDRMDATRGPLGTTSMRCSYMADMPKFLSEIRDNLIMSPKHAFNRFATIHLPMYGSTSNRTLAKIFVEDTLMNSKCNYEIDGLGEMELPGEFASLWKTIPEDLKTEIQAVYEKRGEIFGEFSGMQLFYVEKGIAAIMDVKE